jgi:hypothetical protein
MVPLANNPATTPILLAPLTGIRLVMNPATPIMLAEQTQMKLACNPATPKKILCKPLRRSEMLHAGV